MELELPGSRNLLLLPDPVSKDMQSQSRTAPPSCRTTYMRLRHPSGLWQLQSRYPALCQSHISLTMGQGIKAETVITVRPLYPRTMSVDTTTSKKFRDDDSEASSQISSIISLEDVEAGWRKPKWYRRGRSATFTRWFGAPGSAKINKRKRWCKWILIAVVVLSIFGVIAAM